LILYRATFSIFLAQIKEINEKRNTKLDKNANVFTKNTKLENFFL